MSAPTFLRAATIVSILAFVLLAYLGVNGYVPRTYMVISFGLIPMSFVLEVFVSRRDLIGAYHDRVGTKEWKNYLSFFWVLGSITMFMGAYPLIKLLSSVGQTLIETVYALSVLLVVFAIRRVPSSAGKTAGPEAALKEAESFLAYGRTAQAIQILEQALRRFPAQSDIQTKLREIKTRAT